MTDSWHDKTVDETAARLATDARHGLSTGEVAKRLAQVGPNELRKGEAISPLVILAGQFHSLVIWLLRAAAFVSGMLGRMIDGIAILAVVVPNAVIDFFQDYRAERARSDSQNKKWGQEHFRL